MEALEVRQRQLSMHGMWGGAGAAAACVGSMCAAACTFLPAMASAFTRCCKRPKQRCPAPTPLLQLITRAADALAEEANLLQLAWDVATDGGASRCTAASPRDRPAGWPACAKLLAYPLGRRMAAPCCSYMLPARLQPAHVPSLTPAFPRAAPCSPAPPAGSQAGDVFTVPEMAEFLFSNRKPESCAAALRLLRDDRLYFKQASGGLGTVAGMFGDGRPRLLPLRVARPALDVCAALDQQTPPGWLTQPHSRPPSPCTAGWPQPAHVCGAHPCTGGLHRR